VLINVLLFRAAVEAGSASGWWGTNRGQLLTNAFLFAQLSAVVIWLILGSVPMEKKLALTAPALLPPLATFVMTEGHSHALWDMVMFVQLVATAGSAAWLCARGWQITCVDAPTATPRRAWLQFSVRHLLMVTTGVAVFTAFGKAVVTRFGGTHGLEYLQVAVIGVSLAVLSFVAVWAALGAERGAVRLPLSLLLAILLASLLWWGEATATGIWATAAGPTSGFGWRFRQSVAGGWWFGWTLLAGTFLASWLSVLRATGYRFVRRRLPA
jgi:hypothetical protein